MWCISSQVLPLSTMWHATLILNEIFLVSLLLFLLSFLINKLQFWTPGQVWKVSQNLPYPLKECVKFMNLVISEGYVAHQRLLVTKMCSTASYFELLAWNFWRKMSESQQEVRKFCVFFRFYIPGAVKLSMTVGCRDLKCNRFLTKNSNVLHFGSPIKFLVLLHSLNYISGHCYILSFNKP